MFRYSATAIQVLILTISLSIPGFVPSAHAASMREMTVGIAVTPDFKRIPDWKRKFEKRLAYASKIFKREFKIEFKKKVYFDWQPGNSKADMGTLIEELMNDFPFGKKKVDLVIGLVKLDDMYAESVKDLHVLGKARPFSGYVVIRYPDNPLYKVQEETTLVHEIGHLFGAVHTDNLKSIMSPVVDRQIPSVFDRENREIIKIARDMDFRKGTKAFEKGEIQHLLGSYIKYMQTDQSGEFYLSLGRFYNQLGQRESAIKAMEKAVIKDNKNGIAFYELGSLYAAAGDFDKGAKALSSAVDIFKETKSPHLAGTLNRLGVVYSYKGDLDGAQYAWSRAATLEPGNIDVRINLAVVKMKKGKVDDAIRDYEKILQKDRRNVAALANLGSAYTQKGKYGDAVRHLKTALEAITRQRLKKQRVNNQGVTEQDIQTRLGYVYLKQRNFQQAQDHFQRGCQKNLTLECHMGMGELFYHTKQWRNAVSSLTQAVQADRGNAQLYGLLGTSLAQMGQKEEAVNVLKEGINHTKDKNMQAMFNRNMGNIYMQMRRPDAALAAFHFAITKNWNDIESHYNSGVIYLAQEQFVDARTSFMNVLQISPGHKDASRMLKETENRLANSSAGSGTVQLRGTVR